MDSGPAEEFLQEKLFGSREAVSTLLLSFQLGQTLTEAASTLETFYASHRDVLRACYKVTIREKQKTCVKLVTEKDLGNFAQQNCRIWTVSAHNAADKAVLAALAAKTQKLQTDFSIARLRHLGVITNPLLEDGFTVSEGSTARGKRSISPQTEAAPKTVDQPKEEISESPSSAKATSSTSDFDQRTKGSDAQPVPRQTPSAELKKEDEAAPTRKAKGAAGFFTKSSKSEALKAMRADRIQSKPVREAVVISDEGPDDVEDLDTRHEKGLTKDEQLRRLRESMLEEENVDYSGPDDEPQEGDGDGDVPSPENDAMDVDADSLDPDAEAESLNDNEASAMHTNSPALQRPPKSELTDTPGPPNTRRVRQSVIRKDDEGFDVREDIWVDVPIEADSKSVAPKQAVSESPLEQEPKLKSEIKAEDADSSEPERKRLAKAPPKMPSGQKKQKTLMSFFGKK